MTTIPLWIPDNNPERIYMRTPFELKEAVATLPGARWDPQVRCWHVPATAGAASAIYDRLLGHQLQADAAVVALLEVAVREDAASDHKDAADLPEIPGTLPGWLHQKRAYWFAAERRSSMLAMDMGTGKSRVAISLLDGWEAPHVTILCPRSVVNVWPNQFATHSGRDWKCIVPPGNATVANRAAFIKKHMLLTNGRQPTAVIVNYESAWRPVMAPLLKTLGGVLIMDESHRIKAPGGKASRYCGQLAENMDRVLALTGTPMPHSPLDVYGQFRALDPGVYGTSFTRFRGRYAVMGGFEGRQVIGYQNIDELTRKFGLSSFVVKKDEAGLDLPEVLHVERTFTLSPRALKAYLTIENDFALGIEDGTVTTQNALTKLLRLQQVTSGYVRDDDGVDHQVSEDKIELLADVLEDIPTGEPVVIFARFKHDLKVIRELCEKQRRRYGEVSGDCKPGKPDYGLNESSQMRSELDVVGLQIQSGGVGIDLTRSALAIYYSLDFSLGNYDQTLARVHRPGQQRAVTYIHLIASGTKDEVVYSALQQRREVVEAVIEASRKKKPNDNEAAA